MSGRRPWMVGTDPAGQGGIAAVVGVYAQQGWLARQRVRYLVSHRAGSVLGRVLLFPWALAQLLAALLAGRVSLLHAHVASYGSFARKSLLLALARGFGVPTVFHLHGGHFQKFYAASPAWRQRWIRHTLRRSNRVLALSEAWREALLSIVPEARVSVLANPVAFPPPAPERPAVPGRVLFLGRADRSKGVFDLLTALGQARAQLPRLHLHVGGDGDLEAVRAAVAREGLDAAVTLLGWVRGAAKERELAEAEIFVLPSYDEGLPMAMLEAMARGKAVLATPVGGIPQALRDGVDGLLVAPGQPPRLAEALLRLGGDAPLRAALGASAIERVRAGYATDTVLAELDRIYSEVLR
ncbi:MAG: glycosyltransferase family 4 protein [Comamonadaceae bacterium]|nr:glycosyltransferase family 4 protein [Comamonadaceae bacterium]